MIEQEIKQGIYNYVKDNPEAKNTDVANLYGVSPNTVVSIKAYPEKHGVVRDPLTVKAHGHATKIMAETFAALIEDIASGKFTDTALGIKYNLHPTSVSLYNRGKSRREEIMALGYGSFPLAPLGTHGQSRKKKGPGAPGKMTEETLKAFADDVIAGMPNRELTQKHGISKSMIGHIKRGTYHAEKLKKMGFTLPLKAADPSATLTKDEQWLKALAEDILIPDSVDARIAEKNGIHSTTVNRIRNGLLYAEKLRLLGYTVPLTDRRYAQSPPATEPAAREARGWKPPALFAGEKLEAIRSEIAEGNSDSAVARNHDTTGNTISKIRRGLGCYAAQGPVEMKNGAKPHPARHSHRQLFKGERLDVVRREIIDGYSDGSISHRMGCAWTTIRDIREGLGAYAKYGPVGTVTKSPFVENLSEPIVTSDGETEPIIDFDSIFGVMADYYKDQQHENTRLKARVEALEQSLRKAQAVNNRSFTQSLDHFRKNFEGVLPDWLLDKLTAATKSQVKRF